MEPILRVLTSPGALVALSAFLATFVASVMADEQNERLKQGSFGAIAGSALGGLAAVMQKDSNLLLVGVFGSAVGAVVAWVVYLALSLLASSQWGRQLVEYHVSGLKGVRQQIELGDRNLLLSALTTWSQSFRGMVLRETTYILEKRDSSGYNTWVTIAIRAWLTSLVDAFNLVLDALAEKPEYRSRITLILFGRQNGKIIGRHWISYAGQRDSHTKRDFTADSIAYKVLANELNSPYLTSMESADKGGEDRGNKHYSSFFVFRLNECAVLSLDWPAKIEEHDPYINIAKALLQLDVAPAIGQLLDRWSGSLGKEVKLESISQAQPTAEAAAAAAAAAITTVSGERPPDGARAAALPPSAAESMPKVPPQPTTDSRPS